MRQGEIREWIGMASNITVRKVIEEKLTEASVRKDEFLAMLAHELRNPLAPIASAAEIIKRLTAGDARLRQPSGIITRQVRHPATLVDNLLDVSRVTRGLIELDRRPITLDVVIDSALEQARPLLESKEHSLSVHRAPTRPAVIGDQNRLIQVVVDLLNNAAKYTAERGEIALSVRAGAGLVRGESAALRVTPRSRSSSVTSIGC